MPISEEWTDQLWGMDAAHGMVGGKDTAAWANVKSRVLSGEKMKEIEHILMYMINTHAS